jgi:signal transduction histidine kinase
VLVNLLSNAIKYGVSEIPITVRSETSASMVTVRVQDHGPGIPAEQQEKIFARFFRGTNTTDGKVPGLGLGLYLASRLVKQQSGDIWVESRSGVGTTFSFTLPREKS